MEVEGRIIIAKRYSTDLIEAGRESRTRDEAQERGIIKPDTSSGRQLRRRREVGDGIKHFVHRCRVVVPSLPLLSPCYCHHHRHCRVNALQSQLPPCHRAITSPLPSRHCDAVTTAAVSKCAQTTEGSEALLLRVNVRRGMNRMMLSEHTSQNSLDIRQKQES